MIVYEFGLSHAEDRALWMAATCFDNHNAPNTPTHEAFGLCNKESARLVLSFSKIQIQIDTGVRGLY